MFYYLGIYYRVFNYICIYLVYKMLKLYWYFVGCNKMSFNFVFGI